MSALFEEVYVHDYDEVNQQFKKRYSIPLTLEVIDESDKLLIRSLKNERSPHLFLIEIYKDTPCSEFTKNGFVITEEGGKAIYLQFARQYVYDQEKANYSETDIYRFSKLVSDFRLGRRESVFSLRTDEASATQYFQFYGYLSQQQNMMQDFIRTSTYQRAILSNLEDFQNKVVLDVGAGSGILSFFAVQAGARKVYAVEASSMAKHAQQLVASNKYADRIQVVPGKIEEISLPEKVDVIISEPMGYMLFNERMLETYLHAKKWLKPNGNMFPTRGDLHVAPFTDAQLYTEQLTKANFWYQQNFHGVDLTSLRDAALKEYFYQPVVDTFDIRICLSKSNKYTVDFLKAHEKDLHVIDIPLKFQIHQTDTIHGLAFWFDVAFFGTQQTVWLSTSPTQALTHWYQVRCLIPEPMFVLRGYTVVGRVVLVSNKRQSYNVQIELQIEGMPESRVSNSLDLKNPYFRYSGQPVQPPPGCNNTSPSEDYWQQMDTQMNGNGAPVMMNGGSNNTAATPAAQPMANGINLTMNQAAGMQTGLVMLDESQYISPMPAHNNGLPSRVVTQSTVQPTNLSTPAQSYHNTVNPMVPSVNPLGNILSTGNGSSTNVAGINMNFPVNQNLMIGDYAAAVSGQTIPPYKPI